MTQHGQILKAFRENDGVMSLGYILSHPWGYEFRARITELRHQGYSIVCERGKRPSENIYRLIPTQIEIAA